MRRISLLLAAAALWCAAGCRPQHATRAPTVPTAPATHDWSVRIWSANTQAEVGLEAMLDELATYDFVLVGETHLDAETHRLERVLLEGLAERKPGKVTLSLEMFERDVQPVLDDYLAGRIDEVAFVRGARPWHNYRTGYRPMIEAARSLEVPVVAANLPASVRTKFAMKKADAIGELTEPERDWVPTEIHPPAEAYWDRLEKRLRDHGHGSMQTDDPDARLYSIQNLWDNTMAQAIVDAWAPGGTVMHVAGAFHVEQGLGIGHQIRQRNPDADIVTVTLIPVSDLSQVEPGRDTPLADYEIYVPARARGPSSGEYAVSMTTELRYHLDVPEQPGDAALLVWLADDGAQIEDALIHWRMVLGPEPIIAVVVPPYPRREPDLRQAGQWSWPDSYADDHGRVVEGVERIVDYVRTHFDVRDEAIVLAGAGAGASAALWSALYVDEPALRVVAIEPESPDRFAEAGVPDEPPPGRVTLAASEQSRAMVLGTLRAAGVSVQTLDVPSPNLGWARAESAIFEGLGLPGPPPPQRTIRMAVPVDTPLGRQWGRMFAAAHPGVRIELDFGPKAEGDPIDVPPSVFEAGEYLPLAPGAFGGTTVLVLPDKLDPKTRKAWVALGEADVIHDRSRFHHLAVTDLKGLPGTLDAIEEKGRRNVLIVPAVFVADPERMTELHDATQSHQERLRIAWLPGLGAALAQATHDLSRPNP